MNKKDAPRAIGIIRRIDELGRIVIPKDIRTPFGVKEGDAFELFAYKDGSYLLVPYKDNPLEGPTFLFNCQRNEPALDDRRGQLVVVVSESTTSGEIQRDKNNADFSRFRKFRVRFEDGFIAEVYSSELTLYSI